MNTVTQYSYAGLVFVCRGGMLLLFSVKSNSLWCRTGFKA